MPSPPRNRSIRSYFDQVRRFLIADTDPCVAFQEFSALCTALTHADSKAYEMAYKCLYSKMLPAIQRVVRRYPNRRDEDGIDFFQDVMITLHQALRWDGLALTDEGHLRNYVLRAIENKFRTMARKPAPNPLEPLLEQIGQDDPDMVSWSDSELVQAQLRTLSTDCQQKLLLAAEGFSQADIAARLGIKVDSVKQGIFRCRAILRAKLLAMGFWDGQRERNDATSTSTDTETFTDPA